MGFYMMFVFVSVALVLASGACLTVCGKKDALVMIWGALILAFLIFMLSVIMDISHFSVSHIEHLYVMPAIILSFVFIRLLFQTGVAFIEGFPPKTEEDAPFDNEDEMLAGCWGSSTVSLILGSVLAYFYVPIVESDSVSNQQLLVGLGIAFVVAIFWCCCLGIASKLVRKRNSSKQTGITKQ